MAVYLIAHMPRQDVKRPSEPGRIAQAEIEAANEEEARRAFAELYPDRRITKVGVKGVG